MIGGQLLYLGLADQVDAGIADIAHRNLVVAQHDGGQGGGHAGLAVVLHALVVDGAVCRIEHLGQELRRSLAGCGLLKGLQGGFHGQPAGHFAFIHAADAVGQRHYGAAVAFLLDGLRLPVADKILVVFSGRAGR